MILYIVAYGTWKHSYMTCRNRR